MKRGRCSHDAPVPRSRRLPGHGSRRRRGNGAGTLGLVFSPAIPVAQAAIPTMTRSEIIARAESAIGLRYTWGSESWIPNAGSGQGTDCSGLTLKCWEAPRTMLYQEEDGVNASISPRYTSYEFYNCQGPWSALSSRSSLREGDILVMQRRRLRPRGHLRRRRCLELPHHLRSPGQQHDHPSNQSLPGERVPAPTARTPCSRPAPSSSTTPRPRASAAAI